MPQTRVRQVGRKPSWRWIMLFVIFMNFVDLSQSCHNQLLTFASEILSRIPGRVSVSIDPRLFLPFTASPLDGDIFRRVLARCLKLHNLAFHVLPNLFSSRLLFKIPATPLGIAIANELQRKHSIHTNLTLVFSPIQALACAQAGVSVISPFVGRVKDYYESRGFTMPIKADGTIDMSKHPGVHLVKEIRQMFIAEGYDRQTEIMACGFRSVDEITELCSLGREGGPDLITVQPELLDGLRSRPPLAVAQELGSTKQLKNKPVYFTPLGATDISLALLEGQLAEECIAPIKVSEGLQKFSADANRLEDAIRKSLEKEGSKKLETVLISSGSTLYSYYKAAIIKFLEGWRALSLY